jgi:2,3-bisphosphoglycerate-independent phosphoglycerate mutase
MVIARGFAMLPNWPGFEERYQLKPAAVAGYPMYRGIARLFRMPVLAEPKEPAELARETVKALKDHTFVFAHFKDPDKTGEDGDLDKKVKSIEMIDQVIPEILEAKPDVMIITGDHSTPVAMKGHSWHPVPVLMKAPYVIGPYQESFDEVRCRHGELGLFRACELLPLAMAQAGKLKKFGA